MRSIKRQVARAAMAALVAAVSQAAAATPGGDDFLDLSLDELANVNIKLATATAKPVRLAPAVISIIAANDIRAMGWRTLDEALESVPGLHVSRSSNRLNDLISIRGIHTDFNPQVVVMIDGLPINEVVNGHRGPRFMLPVENIARIEIIRGPGSAVYGADAYAGVINVITKSADELKGAGLRAGSFDTQDVWAQAGGKIADWDIAFSLEYSHSGGDSDRVVNSDLQMILDDAFGTDASLAPGPLETGYQLYDTSLSARRERWTLRLNSWNLRAAGVGPGGAQALDPAGKQDTDHHSIALDYDDPAFAPQWELAARLAYRSLDQHVHFRLLPPGATVPIGADGNLFTPNSLCAPAPVCLVNFPEGVLGNPGAAQDEYRFEAATIYSGLTGQRIRLAAGIDHDKITTRETKNFGPGVIDGTVSPIDGRLTDVTGTANIFIPDSSRTVRYLSVQDEWRLAPDWELTAGVRYDAYSDFGSTTNPRAALVWNAASNLSTKLLYGRAFRAPSFGELYFQNNPVTQGNRGLKPETLNMLELAVHYRPTPAWQTVAGLFGYQGKHLIEYVNRKAQNSGELTGKGLEAEATWQASNAWRIKGNVSLQYAENDKTGEAVPNAPRRQAYLAAIWQPAPGWSASAQAKWIADRPRDVAAGDTRPAIADYTLVNLTVRHQPSQRWELAALVHNLFDEDAREPSRINDGVVAIPDDYPLEGRALFIETRFHPR